MKIIDTVAEMTSRATAWQADGKTVALVATMGALHAGQEALIRAAAQKADIVVVTIFANAFQLASNESAADYPHSREDDLRRAEASGAHAAFTPSQEELYPKGFSTWVSEETISKLLCGVSRPTHFRGVVTLMTRLCNLVRPKFVYFGQKTAQRAAVMRKVASDLGTGIEIVAVPTVREEDGLAAGTRNKEFTPSQRQEALALIKALRRMKEMVDSGVRSPDRLVAEATFILGQHRRVRVIYIAVVDPQTMEAVRGDVVSGKALAAIAAWVDEIRLIDNMPL